MVDEHDRPLITTNGMFIIDDIVDLKGNIHKDIAGGGGMFAMLGGCIASPSSDVAGTLRWIVDCGYDFPSELKERIESWQSGALFREDPTRETTRGWNGYSQGDLREFKYLNEKKTITAVDWKEFGQDSLRRIKCVHFVCSAKRCSALIQEMKQIGCSPKVIVWEPIPDLCDYAHFDEISEIIQAEEDFTMVFSPNAEEGARLFGDTEPLTLEEITELLWKYDKILCGGNSCVLRRGKLGSLSLSAKDGKTGKRTIKQFPAYHASDPTQVIDPTGGGNSFLGGFCVGYTATGNLEVGNICGNIAAGCVIEQMGVPRFNPTTREWNGLTLKQRLDRYLEENPSLTLRNADELYRSLS